MIAWYNANRARSRELFAAVAPEAFYTRPIPLRHPFVFYEGHLPAFSYLVLHERALGNPALDAQLEKLFERGIDPRDADAAAGHGRSDWPGRDEVQEFGARCDAAVLDDLARAALDDPQRPLLVGAEAAWNILEHEEMHHETLAYLIHQLPLESKTGPSPDERDEMPEGQHDTIAVPAGRATLGKARGSGFAWDNEHDETAVDVNAFSIDRYNVTNGHYLAFLRAGGPVPPFWVPDGSRWRLRTAFDEIPLPNSWPVYVTHEQAAAFAAWAGGRLPTEAEFHRAAYGTPNGAERRYPWGDEAPGARHGNFGFRQFDPEPIGSSPAGASAWGVEDLVGNGWEWTATPFGPLPGFRPMASYPQYSADFFDGKHYVMKGASPVTSTHLLRRSFRNWFYEDYPYMYASFRCVYD
jgi:formylglycine-generating enzyme required for sulfatase activity